ncbi:MAG: protein kinase, partial [Byssovorax sp.]
MFPTNAAGGVAGETVSAVTEETGGDATPGADTTLDVGASSSDQLLREIARVDDAPPRAADLVGARIGRFRVAAMLGRGGMGVVYRAADEALRRDVALKVLPPALIDDEERRRRLLREARSAAAVSHPSIATIYEVGEDEGRVYIAMELVRGRTLSAVLAEGRPKVAEALRIARGILDGIGKA